MMNKTSGQRNKKTYTYNTRIQNHRQIITTLEIKADEKCTVFNHFFVIKVEENGKPRTLCMREEGSEVCD